MRPSPCPEDNALLVKLLAAGRPPRAERRPHIVWFPDQLGHSFCGQQQSRVLPYAHSPGREVIYPELDNNLQGQLARSALLA